MCVSEGKKGKTPGPWVLMRGLTSSVLVVQAAPLAPPAGNALPKSQSRMHQPSFVAALAAFTWW
jgi:hypothetical protein